MYNEELDMALESAYDDGYVQALLDMGVDPNEIAEEDVDMYDDYDEAMEGPAREYRRRANAGKSRDEIQKERYNRTPYLKTISDPNYHVGMHPQYRDIDRNYGERHFNRSKEMLSEEDRKIARRARDNQVRRYR